MQIYLLGDLNCQNLNKIRRVLVNNCDLPYSVLDSSSEEGHGLSVEFSLRKSPVLFAVANNSIIHLEEWPDSEYIVLSFLARCGNG